MEPITICDLPDELLVVIFSYLPLLGRKCARLVCKHWYGLCESGTLTKNDVLTVSKPHELGNCTIFRRNLRIYTDEETLKDNTFWRTKGGKVKELQLYGFIKDKSKVFNLISNYTKNLQLLLLSDGCKCCESPSLNNLTSLVLNNLNDMEGDDLERLTAHAPNVKNLYLRRCFNMRPSLLPAIIKLLARQSSIIQKLYFEDCRFVNDDTLKLMLNEIGPQLTGIYLFRSSLSGNAVFYPERFAHLTEIDLSRNDNLTNQCFSTIFKSLKKLRLVSLQEDKIDDNVFGLILDLPDLKGLDISGCSLLTSQGIITAFTRRSLPKMRDLRINNLCEIMTDQVVQSFCRNLPNLTHMGLDNSVLTELSLSSLSLNCKLLTTLSLINCPMIRDGETPVYKLLNSFKGLVYLDLVHCDGVNNNTISNLQLPNLRSLGVPGSVDVEPLIDSLLTRCPSLQTIDIETVYRIKLDPILKTSSPVTEHYCGGPPSIFNEPFSFKTGSIKITFEGLEQLANLG